MSHNIFRKEDTCVQVVRMCIVWGFESCVS